MATTPDQLCQFVAALAETTVYGPVAANQRVIVTNIIIANTSASPVALSLSAVPSGGAAGNANRIIPGTTIPANTMVPIDCALVLEAGGFLSALGGAANSITVTISGVVVV
jgi:hypothetical protein